MNPIEQEFQLFLLSTFPGGVPAKDSVQYVQLRFAFYFAVAVSADMHPGARHIALMSFHAELKAAAGNPKELVH